MLGVGQGVRSFVFSGFFRSSPKLLVGRGFRSQLFQPFLGKGFGQSLSSRQFHNFSFEPPKTGLGAKLALHLPKSLIGGRYSSLYVDPEDFLKEPSLLEKFLPRLESFTLNLNNSSFAVQDRFLIEMEKLIIKEPRFEGLIAPFASKFLCQRAAFSPFFWKLVAKHHRLETAQEMLSILQNQGGERFLNPLFASQNSIVSSFILENLGAWKIDSDTFLLQLFKLVATRQEKNLTSLLWTQTHKTWETIFSDSRSSLLCQTPFLEELLKLDRSVLKEAPIEWIFQVAEKGGLTTRMQLLKFLVMKNETSLLEDFFSRLSPLPEADFSQKEISLMTQIAKCSETEEGNIELKNLIKKFFQSSEALLMVKHKELYLFLGSHLLYGKETGGWENFLSKMLEMQKLGPEASLFQEKQTLVKLNQQKPFPPGVAALLAMHLSPFLELGDLFSLSRLDKNALDSLFFMAKDPFSLVRTHWDQEIQDLFFEKCAQKNQGELWKNLHITPTNIRICLRYFWQNGAQEYQKIFTSKLENLSDKEQIEILNSIFPKKHDQWRFSEGGDFLTHPIDAVQTNMQDHLFSTFLQMETKVSANVASHLFSCALRVENGVEKFSTVYQNPHEYLKEANWNSQEADVFLDLLYRQKKLLCLLGESILQPLAKTIAAKVLASPYIEEFLIQGKSCELALFLANFDPKQLHLFLEKFETFSFKKGGIDEEATKLISKVRDLLKFYKRDNFLSLASLWSFSLKRAFVRGKGSLVRGWKNEFSKMGKFFVFFPMLYIQRWDGYQNTLVAENLREMFKRAEEILKSGDTHALDNLLSFLEILDLAPLDPTAKIQIVKSIFQFTSEEKGELSTRHKRANQIVYRISVMQLALGLNLASFQEVPSFDIRLLEKVLPFLQTMSSDYKQQFMKKILHERLREAWFRYYSGAQEQKLMPQFLELTDRMVLNEQSSRYANLPFQGMWDETTIQIWEKWKNNREFPTAEGGCRVLFTDDPTDLFLCGDEVSNSCMHTANKNPSLLHYTNEGVIKMIAVKNAQGGIEARAMVRLIWNASNNRPALFLETLYGKPAHFESIQEAAGCLSSETQLELFGLDFQKGGVSNETSLIAFEKPSTKGWSDLIGRFDRRTTVSARLIQKSSTQEQYPRYDLISRWIPLNSENYDWLTLVMVLLGVGTLLKKSSYYSSLAEKDEK